MRCSACGRNNDPNALFCLDCAAELVSGAARELEPPRARGRRGRWFAAQAQRLGRAWNDLGYPVQGVRTDWRGSISAAKRATAAFAFAARRAALVLAAAVPGLGHIALGQRRRGRTMLGIFLLGAVGWVAFMGTAVGGFMVFVMASAVLSSVADCLRITYDGPRALPRLSHIFWAVAIVCGTYALGVWLLSLRWERAITNLNIVRLAPPEPDARPAQVLAAGDRLLVTRSAYRDHGPARGDVVLARAGGQTVIQRVLAVPGDRLEFSQGSLWLNGEPLAESQYPLQPLNAVEVHGAGQVVAMPWSGVLGEGRYAVWGFQEAEGARLNLGPTVVGRADILGRMWLVYSPYRHRRFVDHTDPALATDDQGE